MSSKLENGNETKKNKLYMWKESGIGVYAKKKGVPRNVETLIKESHQEIGAGQWTMYISGFHQTPPIGEHAFPKKIYLEIPTNTKITFDFLENAHHVKIISEEMLNVLKEHGLTENYELAPVTVINRKGQEIETEKNYFALRFYKFDNDLLDFGDVKVLNCDYDGYVITHTQVPLQKLKGLSYNMHPNMKVKEGVNKKIFALHNTPHQPYQKALVFTEEIKDLIVEKGFVGQNIYSMDELWKAYTDEKPEGF